MRVHTLDKITSFKNIGPDSIQTTFPSPVQALIHDNLSFLRLRLNHTSRILLVIPDKL